MAPKLILTGFMATGKSALAPDAVAGRQAACRAYQGINGSADQHLRARCLHSRYLGFEYRAGRSRRPRRIYRRLQGKMGTFRVELGTASHSVVIGSGLI